ncbi:MAG: hypothetical protein HBSIN02_00210 [Bacteroidia bacterium]|nr:MAG: hypothetical protein HBSIN02_00210 [Bacteroidia bacterium]
MSRVSNRQLVDELKSGHHKGAQNLVQLYQRTLITECVRSFSLDLMDAEEIANDVLVAVIQKIHQFQFKRSESDFHFWVMAILRNRVRDFVRRGVRAGCDGAEFPRGPFAEDRASIHAAIWFFERSWQEDEPARPDLSAVADALEALKPWERVLLQCRAVGMSYGDIAEYTGKTCDQLKVYYARVKTKFKRLITERLPAMAPETEDTPLHQS